MWMNNDYTDSIDYDDYERLTDYTDYGSRNDYNDYEFNDYGYRLWHPARTRSSSGDA